LSGGAYFGLSGEFSRCVKFHAPSLPQSGYYTYDSTGDPPGCGWEPPQGGVRDEKIRDPSRGPGGRLFSPEKERPQFRCGRGTRFSFPPHRRGGTRPYNGKGLRTGKKSNILPPGNWFSRWGARGGGALRRLPFTPWGKRVPQKLIPHTHGEPGVPGLFGKQGRGAASDPTGGGGAPVFEVEKGEKFRLFSGGFISFLPSAFRKNNGNPGGNPTTTTGGLSRLGISSGGGGRSVFRPGETTVGTVGASSIGGTPGA